MKKFKAMVALLLCASMLAACSNGGNLCKGFYRKSGYLL